MSNIHLVDFSNKDGSDRTIADCLREMARAIDEGKIATPLSGVIVLAGPEDPPKVMVYGMGGQSPMEGIGLLSMARMVLETICARASGCLD